MIVKFREDHIVRLERLHKEAGGSLLPKEQDDLLRELREELQVLREQVSLWFFPSRIIFSWENSSRDSFVVGGYRLFRKEEDGWWVPLQKHLKYKEFPSLHN